MSVFDAKPAKNYDQNYHLKYFNVNIIIFQCRNACTRWWTEWLIWNHWKRKRFRFNIVYVKRILMSLDLSRIFANSLRTQSLGRLFNASFQFYQGFFSLCNWTFGGARSNVQLLNDVKLWNLRTFVAKFRNQDSLIRSIIIIECVSRACRTFSIFQWIYVDQLMPSYCLSLWLIFFFQIHHGYHFI